VLLTSLFFQAIAMAHDFGEGQVFLKYPYHSLAGEIGRETVLTSCFLDYSGESAFLASTGQLDSVRFHALLLKDVTLVM
jgi:hypothetical protein